jgi:predicted amidohydrolase
MYDPRAMTQTPKAAASGSLTVALLSEVFVGDDAGRRLGERLEEAAGLGAGLVVLPELPLNDWSPASPHPRDEDAEPPFGPRHGMLSRAAAEARVGVLGGAIVRDPATGRRRNTALLFDAGGRPVHSWTKLHLPDEEGFRETRHYEPGEDPPTVCEAFGLPLGVQICSDVNRPEGTHLLGALGAEAVLCPRATERGTWERWKTVLRAGAITSAVYVLSVNRPEAERGVPLGGPSIAVDPDGAVILETTGPIAVVTLTREAVARSRRAYPGYMPVRGDVYARGWERASPGRAGR